MNRPVWRNKFRRPTQLEEKRSSANQIIFNFFFAVACRKRNKEKNNSKHIDTNKRNFKMANTSRELWWLMWPNVMARLCVSILGWNIQPSNFEFIKCIAIKYRTFCHFTKQTNSMPADWLFAWQMLNPEQYTNAFNPSNWCLHSTTTSLKCHDTTRRTFYMLKTMSHVVRTH